MPAVALRPINSGALCPPYIAPHLIGWPSEDGKMFSLGATTRIAAKQKFSA